jgi:hypothetical protein
MTPTDLVQDTDAARPSLGEIKAVVALAIRAADPRQPARAVRAHAGGEAAAAERRHTEPRPSRRGVLSTELRA